MIRTLTEIRQGRVTIQETGTNTTITVAVDGPLSTPLIPGERLYTSEEVGHYQATEAELITAPLRLRITELERDRGRNQEAQAAVLDLERRNSELASKLAVSDKIRADIDWDNVKLRDKIRDLGAKLAESRAEIKTVEQSLAARDHLLSGATTLIERVRELVWTVGLDVLMEERGVPGRVEDYATELARVVGRVRATVGSPDPGPGTSQA